MGESRQQDDGHPKESKEALTRRVRKLEQLLEHAPALVYTGYTPEGAGQVGCKLLGRDVSGDGLETLQNDPSRWLELMHPDDRSRVEHEERTQLAETGRHVFEYRILHKDGRYRWIQESAWLVPEESGTGTRVERMGYCQDVTERKWAQERLKRRQQELVEAERVAQFGTWSWDLRADQGNWSDELYRIYGLEPQAVKVTSEMFLNLVHPNDRNRVEQNWKQVGTNGKVWNSSIRIQRPDGEIRYVDVRAVVVWDHDGQPVRMYGIQQDVTGLRSAIDALHGIQLELEERVHERTQELIKTNRELEMEVIERKRTEEQLKKRERQLLEAQELAHMGNWEWEVGRGIVTWSKELCQLCGITSGRGPRTREEALAFVHPDDREAMSALTDEACRTRQSFSYFYRVVRGDGTIRILRDRGHVLVNEEQGPITLVGTALDVTELKQTEEELHRAQNYLHAKNDDLRALTARLIAVQEDERRRISRELHDEMNQKLALLAVEVDAVAEVLDRAAVSSEAIQRVQDRVADLSDDIRRLAYHLHPSILDHLGLEVALKSYVDELSVQEDLTVEVVVEDLPAEMPQAIASTLYRVAQESLRNVGKHACTDRAIVSLKKKDGGVELSVKDWGTGFELGDELGARRSLGLVSMEERVRLVDGAFRIHTCPGEGTEVLAWVPLQDRQ